MKKQLGIVLLALTFAVPGHAAKKPNVAVTTDRFTGVTTVLMKTVDIMFTADRMCFLRMTAIATSAAPTPTLVIGADCDEWQYLHGVTAHALIDGQRVDFQFNVTSTKTTFDRPQTHEVLAADVPKDVMDRIAKCQTFEMELGRYAFTLKPKGLEPLRDFNAAVSALVK